MGRDTLLFGVSDDADADDARTGDRRVPPDDPDTPSMAARNPASTIMAAKDADAADDAARGSDSPQWKDDVPFASIESDDDLAMYAADEVDTPLARANARPLTLPDDIDEDPVPRMGVNENRCPSLADADCPRTVPTCIRCAPNRMDMREEEDDARILSGSLVPSLDADTPSAMATWRSGYVALITADDADAPDAAVDDDALTR